MVMLARAMARVCQAARRHRSRNWGERSGVNAASRRVSADCQPLVCRRGPPQSMLATLQATAKQQ